MNKQELINYINNYLQIGDFSDSSKNGLQVDNTKNEIKKIAYAVDATTYIFDKAIKENVDLILVHHGLFWGFESVLIWLPFKRAKKLIESNIALAAYHIPLDAHEEVGNNAWLVQEFVKTYNLQDYEKQEIIEYKWKNIWFGLKFEEKIAFSDLEKFLDNAKLEKEIYNFWNKKFIKSVAFCSGGAWSEIKQVNNLWYDLYITWEAAHHEKTYAKELGQSVIYAGHYETEIFWPRLLAKHLEEKFGLEIVELDEKY